MTFTEAAEEILRLAGKPLHYKEITEAAIEKNLLYHVGKSPEVTMGARLAALLKKEEESNIVRVKPGVFALKNWGDKKPAKADEVDDAAQASADAEADAASEVNALDLEAVAGVTEKIEAPAPAPKPAPAAAPTKVAPVRGRGRSVPAPRVDEDDDEPPTKEAAEDAKLADLAASGAELFDDEEDDDQPILALSSTDVGAAAADSEGGRRRRSRRRRRGRPEGGELEGRIEGAVAVDGPPGPDARFAEGRDQGRGDQGRFDDDAAQTPREPSCPSRPVVRDRQSLLAGPSGPVNAVDAAAPEGEEFAGRDLADVAAAVLVSYDRNQGPIPVRGLAEALMRRGRLGTDLVQATVQLSASLRADNLRRQAKGERPRFRFASGGRVAPTDWSMSHELLRLEQDVANVLERYRDHARRMLLRRLQELPGHAFLELALVALERAGLSQIRPVRRPGSPGGESHFSAMLKNGHDELRVALVIRKDGREVGRERVAEVRGTLHHYGPAAATWIVTTGQVLSGAREEATLAGAAPVALFDGIGLCKLLEEAQVGVTRSTFSVAIPDLDLLDTLRGV